MDKKTTRTLQEINRDAAKGREKKLLKEVDRYANERETLGRIASSGDPEARRKAQALLERPELYKKDYVINEKEAQRRDKEVEGRVKEAIKRGDIPPPKINETHQRVLKNFRR